MPLTRGRAKLALAAVVPLLAAMFAIAFAGHIVGNPAHFVLKPVKPPVYWLPGTNNGSTDINGQLLTVSLSANKTTATVSAAITYGINEYVDVLRINVTNAPVTLYLYVSPTSSNVTSYLNTTASYIEIVNPTSGLVIFKEALGQILSNGGLSNSISITSNGVYVVNIVLDVLDGKPLGSALTLSMTLYYTKSSETPIT